jgi:tyrosinase
MTGVSTVGLGRCVVDGAFTELRPVRCNHTYIPHCLSQGFRDGNDTGRLPSTPFSPVPPSSLLTKQSYQECVREVGYSVRSIMHQSIAGKLLALTATDGIVARFLNMKHTW